MLFFIRELVTCIVGCRAVVDYQFFFCVLGIMASRYLSLQPDGGIKNGNGHEPKGTSSTSTPDSRMVLHKKTNKWPPALIVTIVGVSH